MGGFGNGIHIMVYIEALFVAVILAGLPVAVAEEGISAVQGSEQDNLLGGVEFLQVLWSMLSERCMRTSWNSLPPLPRCTCSGFSVNQQPSGRSLL